MKLLILKLGVLVFSFLFMLGVWKEIPTGTLVFRTFVVFLAIETILVLTAVVFIKMTEKIRKDIEEEMEISEEKPEIREQIEQIEEVEQAA